MDKLCSLVGTLGEGWWGKACHAVAHPKQVLGAAKALVSGKPGQALKTLLNGAKNNVLSPAGALGITAIVAWAVGGAHFVLSETAKLVGQSTSPELTAAWFSSVYWRIAGVAALLTLPFLFAAAVQAVLRADGTLIARATLGYLPLSFLATGVAAPLAMMLLAATDWMGSAVASAAGDQGSHFLVTAGAAIGGLGVVAGSPFVTFLIALLTAAGGLILWLELLVRAAAVYVVVLMLPLVFAAMVWPARRIWATRAVEVLVALILAKFAIVSVLALAAAALGHGGGSLIVKSLAGLVLVMLGAFAPWVLLRLLPLAEVASSVAGHMRHHAQAQIAGDVTLGRQGVGAVAGGAAALVGRMKSLAADATDAAAPSPPNRAAVRAAAAALAKTETPEGSEVRPPEMGGAGPDSDPSLPAARVAPSPDASSQRAAGSASGPTADQPAPVAQIKSTPRHQAANTQREPSPTFDTPTLAEPAAPPGEDQPMLPPPDHERLVEPPEVEGSGGE